MELIIRRAKWWYGKGEDEIKVGKERRVSISAFIVRYRGISTIDNRYNDYIV